MLPDPRYTQIHSLMTGRIAYQIEIFIRDKHKTVFSYMAVSRKACHLFINIPLKSLGIISHLDKTAAVQNSAGIFHRHAAVRNCLISLYQLFFSIQQGHKFFRLLSAAHIKIQIFRRCACDNDSTVIHNIDLGNIIFFQEREKRAFFKIAGSFQIIPYFTCQFQQIFIRCIINVGPYIFNVQRKHLICVIYRKPCLQHVDEQTGNRKSQYDTERQPA